MDKKLEIFSIRAASKDHDWREVQNKNPILSDWGINQLQSGLRNHVSSVVVEPNYICKDHRNLYSNFYSKKFTASSPLCSRLHFFSENIPAIDALLLEAEKYSDSYLGYSIIRPVKERCLGRTVIDPLKIGKDNSGDFFCLRTSFNVHLSGRKFIASGYPYTSQDTDATVCAHSALWGVCRYLSERYRVYREVYPYDLIRMTGNAQGRTVPYRGMTYADYSTILSDFGCYPVIMRTKNSVYEKAVDPDAFKDLYTYVESGFPVLASFHGHVVTLIGHSIDYERAFTTDIDGFVDSSAFLKQFVVADDNFFPYALLGYKGDADNYGSAYDESLDGLSYNSLPKYLYEFDGFLAMSKSNAAGDSLSVSGLLKKFKEFLLTGRSGYTIDSITTAVIPLPEKAFLPADKARNKALKVFKKVLAVVKATGSGPWVTRLFLTTGSAFKKRKLEAALESSKAKPDKLLYFATELTMPHFIWVMEISPVENFKKGCITGEVILDATSGQKEDGIIYMRIGNKQVTKIDGKSFENQFSDCPHEFVQFTHNLGEVN